MWHFTHQAMTISQCSALAFGLAVPSVTNSSTLWSSSSPRHLACLASLPRSYLDLGSLVHRSDRSYVPFIVTLIIERSNEPTKHHTMSRHRDIACCCCCCCCSVDGTSSLVGMPSRIRWSLRPG